MIDGPKIVSLRDGRPSLQDIPGRLRLLADQIEAGEYEDVETCHVIIPKQKGFPRVRSLGSIDGENGLIHQLELAKFDFLAHIKGLKSE